MGKRSEQGAGQVVVDGYLGELRDLGVEAIDDLYHPEEDSELGVDAETERGCRR